MSSKSVFQCAREINVRERAFEEADWENLMSFESVSQRAGEVNERERAFEEADWENLMSFESVFQHAGEITVSERAFAAGLSVDTCSTQYAAVCQHQQTNNSLIRACLLTL